MVGARCLVLRRGFSSQWATYVQGQSPQKKIREYFYFIDHQGMLFLDDSRMKNFTSCFKDKEFLVFFFKRLRQNTSERYPNFPYLSLCGRERNFVRCDDVPVVYSHVINKDGEERFCYGNAGDLLHNKFEPEKVVMSPTTGRVYHPCHDAAGSVGLVQSKRAIEFSKYFTFLNGEESPPTSFQWNGVEHQLNLEWFEGHKAAWFNKE